MFDKDGPHDIFDLDVREVAKSNDYATSGKGIVVAGVTKSACPTHTCQGHPTCCTSASVCEAYE